MLEIIPEYPSEPVFRDPDVQPLVNKLAKHYGRSVFAVLDINGVPFKHVDWDCLVELIKHLAKVKKENKQLKDGLNTIYKASFGHGLEGLI